MPQETNRTKVVRIKNAVAAGTGDTQTSAILDTAGFTGVRLIAAFGTITATAVTSVKIQDGNDSGLSDAHDVAGSGLSLTPTTDNNSLAILDIYRPVKRYLTLVVTRATANAVIDGMFAELYEGRDYPEAADSTVSHQKLLVSPADGTP
jgi:predicted outer membrane lipoprotein